MVFLSRDNLRCYVCTYSAGIGRTGTFLAIDYLLQQAKKDGIIDVYHYTSVMRKSRVNMIQTLVG